MTTAEQARHDLGALLLGLLDYSHLDYIHSNYGHLDYLLHLNYHLFWTEPIQIFAVWTGLDWID